jgi:type III pantothenate kinase
MMLLIDIGNSRLKWATFNQDGTLSPQKSIAYKEADSLELSIAQSWLELEMPWQGVYLASVADQLVNELISNWVRNSWGIDIIFMKTAASACGVVNGYEKPEQLGVDRWLALIGARDLTHEVTCIVDCGTAITLDILTSHGHHAGGLILPNETMMQNSLLNNTSDLKKLIADSGNNKHYKLLGRDTQTGILSGSVYAVVGLLEYVLQRLEKNHNHVKLILTGGGATTFVPLIQRPCSYMPDLVLHGMAVMVKQRL